MPRTKISEFSVTPGDNTDIDGINIAEGCAPSGINDAIRELMAQLKDFQSGAAGDSITVVGTLAAKGTSSSGADLKLYEDTDNGTNYVGFIAPASIASNVQWTLPSADGSSGQALQTNGSGTLSFATLGISAGGTGQTTANAAFNALAPSQTSNAGRYLKTDGTNTSWDLLDISTADITGTLPVANGGTGITSFGTGVATALGINVGSSGAFVTNGGALGTPSSGTVTNLTGTASININGTVGATTPTTGAFTTLSASGNITVSGGTANGVAYLNGSKVLTTGSALSFDGTNFGLGGSADAWSGTYRALQVNGTVPVFGSQTQYMHVLSNAYNDGSWKYKVSSAAARYTQDIGVHYWDTAVVGTAGAALTWNEQMRLNSTGLGIGTSSPSAKLQVYDAGNSFSAVFGAVGGSQVVTIGNSGKGASIQGFSNSAFAAYADLVLQPDGKNLGLGVTPSAWGSGQRAIQTPAGAIWNFNAFNMTITQNAFSDGTERYIGNGFASKYNQNSGIHQWSVAPSGTAGNAISFTQAMTLNASGNLLVGTTTDKSTALSGSGNGITIGGSVSPNLVLWDTDNAAYLSVFAQQGTDTVFGNLATGPLRFYTDSAERARITSGGDLLVGATSLGAWDTRLTLSSDTGTTKWGVGPYSTATNFVISASASAGVYLAGTTATSWSSVSDERHKDIIEPIANAAEKVCTLRAVIGKYKADETSTRKSFLIAQDVLAVLPEAVDISNPERFGLAYSDMVPLLVAAIQEQQALITDLRARVAALESQA